MFKKWNRILAFLLSIALVTTTFGSDFASAKVYAEENEIVEESDETEEPKEETTIADLPAAEVIPQDELGGGNGEGSGNSGNNEEGTTPVVTSTEGNGEGTPTLGDPVSTTDEPEYELDEDGNPVLDENGNPKLKEKVAEDETEEEVVETEEEVDGIKIYYVVSNEDAGSVSKKSEVFAENKELEGSTAEAFDGYKFVNWTDEDGKIVCDDEYFLPEASDLGVSEDAEDAEGEEPEDEVKEITFTANFVAKDEGPTFNGKVIRSVEVDGVQVDFWAEQGVLPDDARFEVKRVYPNVEAAIEKDLEAVINEELDSDEEVEVEVKDTVSFDIKIFADSYISEDNEDGYIEIDNNDKVKVTFTNVAAAASSASDADTGLAVYHVDGSDVEYQDHDKVSKEDSITFDAEHFSTYTVTIYHKTYKSDAAVLNIKIRDIADKTKEIGSDISEEFTVDNYRDSTAVKSIDEIKEKIAESYKADGYVFVKATIGDNSSSTEVKSIKLKSSGKIGIKDSLQYSYDNSSYSDLGNNEVYFWYAKEGTIFTVKYDINGGVVNSSFTNLVADVTNKAEFTAITVPKNQTSWNNKTAFTKTNFEFYGWSTDKNAKWNDDSVITGGSEYRISADDDEDEDGVIKLYAVWKSKYTYKIKYDKNSGSGTISPSEVTELEPGDVTMLPSGSGLSKSGYTFLGWSVSQTEPGLVVKGKTTAEIYTAGSPLELTDTLISNAKNKVITLYAVWANTTLKGQLVIAVRGDGKVPNEPAIQSDDDKYYTLYDGYDYIELSKYFTPVATVTGEAGVNEALTPYFRETVDKLIANSTDEEFLQKYHDGNKRIRWYVIKHQSNDGRWHIDGVIEDVERVRISYDENGAQSGTRPASVQYDKGEEATVSGNVGNLQKSGYDFIGWNTKPDGSGDNYKAGDKITLNDNVTLYANWKSKARYFVEYKVNGLPEGVTVNVPGKVSYYDGQEVTVAQKLADIEGYTFSNWSTEDVNVQSGKFNMPKKNVTFTCTVTKRKYQVTVENDDGFINVTGAGQYEFGKDVTLGYTLKNGYEFAGWTGDETTSTFKMPAKDVTVKANAKPISYEITYHLQDGSLATKNPASYTVETEDFTLNNPEKQGYVFAGWTGTDLNSATKTVTVRKGSTGKREYTATWTAAKDTKYTVYHAQEQLDGSFKVVDTDNLTGETGKEVTPATKTYTGFKSPAPQKLTILADGTAELTYNYTRNSYTVTVNKSTGIKSTSGAGTYQYGAPVKVGFALEDGYAFDGWTGDKTEDSFTMPASKVTMQANAKPISYEITYHLQGGSLATKNPASYTVETEDFTLNNPEKQGYVFAGWTGTDLNSATKTVTVKKGSTGDRSYTATWTPDSNTEYRVYHEQEQLDGTYKRIDKDTQVLHGTTGTTVTPDTKDYTGFVAPEKQEITILADGSAYVIYQYVRDYYNVVFDVQGHGTAPTTQRVKFEDTATVPEVPEDDDYTFAGWYTEAECKNEYNFATPVTENITLFAKWRTILLVDAVSDSKTYDTKALEASYTLNRDIDEKYTVSVTYAGNATITDAGTEYYTIDSVKITEGGVLGLFAKDVTSTEFDVRIADTKASLVVEPIEITVAAKSASMTFDGSTLTESGYDIYVSDKTDATSIAVLEAQKSGITATTKGSQTIAGQSPNTIDTVSFDEKNAKKQNYKYTPIPGTLTVEGRGDNPIRVQIAISADGRGGDVVTYDGKPHTAHLDVDANVLPGSGSNNTDNESENSDDEQPGFVEQFFTNVTRLLGTLTIRVFASEDSTLSKDVVYNDKTFTVRGIAVSGGTGIDGGTYPILLDKSGIYVTLNVDGKDEDVKDQFAIDVVTLGQDEEGKEIIGNLLINRRKVTLSSESASQTYNGNALTRPVVTVGEDGFVDGEIINLRATGSITNAGSVENTIVYEFNPENEQGLRYLDEETGKDLFENNYDLTLRPGTLTVNNPSSDDDNPGDPTTIPDVPVALAPSGAVLGAQRATGDGPAVLGARRAGTDDETNRMARVFAMVAAAAIAVTMMITGKKKDEEEEG